MVYYSHSVQIYGTIKEESERTFLDKKFRKIICPNRDMGGYRVEGGIEHFLNLISQCEALVFSEFQGFVGRGVYAEICRARGEGKDVWILRKVNSKYKLLKFRKLKLHDESDWKEQYGIAFSQKDNKY